MKARYAPGVAQPGAMAYVVGADHRTQVLLEQVVVFVRRLGACVGGDTVRPVPLAEAYQGPGGEVQRLIPGRLPPVLRTPGRLSAAGTLRVSPDQGRAQPRGVSDEVDPEAPFDTQPAEVRRGVERGVHPDDPLVHDVEANLAAHTAVRADGSHDPVWLHPFCSNSNSTLPLRAPVGQTYTQFPRNTQVVSGIGSP